MTITERFEVDDEVIKEKTYLVTDRKEIDQLWTPLLVRRGEKDTEVTVRFIFDPPLVVPQ